jgi:hypothetical protein
LIGRILSSLPWLTDNDEAASDLYPWKAAKQTNLRQRGVSMRLQIGSRHTHRLNVNASPIPGPDGTPLGVLVTFNDQTAVEADNLQMSRFVSRFNEASENFGRLRQQLESRADRDHLAELDKVIGAAREMAEVLQSVAPTDSSAAPGAMAAKAESSTKDNILNQP